MSRQYRIVYIYLCGIFMLLCINLFAAGENTEQDIPQLIRQIKKASIQKKPYLYNEIAILYLGTSPEKSLKCCDSAIVIARGIKDYNELSKAYYNKGEALVRLFRYEEAVMAYNNALEVVNASELDEFKAEILSKLGSAYRNDGKYVSARSCFLKAVDIYIKLNNELKTGRLYLDIGTIYQTEGNYTTAASYFQKAILLFDKQKNLQDIADGYNMMGILYYDLGNYSNALNNFLAAKEIYEKIDYKTGQSASYNNIGLLYSDLGNREKALEYYQKSLKIDQELNDLSGIASSYNNIGIIYSEWGQNDIAVSYYNKSLSIYVKQNDKEGQAMVHNNMGESFCELGQINEGLDHLFKSLKMEQQFNNKTGIAQSYLSLANVHFTMGKYKEALEYNQLAFSLADSLNLSSQVMDVYELYYKIYAEKRDFEKAYQYLKNFHVLKSQLFDNNFEKNIAEFSSRYAIELRENENKRLMDENAIKNKELRKQRIYLIIILSLVLLMGIIVFFDLKIKKRANSELQSKNQELTDQKIKLEITFEELQNSEQKYRNLVKNSPTGILLLDTQGKIIEVNDKILEILGSPGEQATKQINCLTFPPLKQAGLSDDLMKCIQSGELVYNECEYLSKWDKKLYVRYYLTPVKNVRGETHWIIMNLEDVTSRKLAEIALQESEFKYRILVEKSLQVMLIVQDFKLVFANSRLVEQTGYTLAELMKSGEKWLEVIIHPDDREFAQKLMKARISGENVPPVNIVRFIRKDGRIRWIETTGANIDYHGKPANLIMAVDITEKKESDNILVESEQKLREANLTKDKFFSIIAHDLKNPFNAILGFSELLYVSYESFNEDQKKHFIRNIFESASRTYRLIENLLNWSRSQTGKLQFNPEVLNMHTVINEMISDIRSSADFKQISIHSDIDSHLNAIADKNLIQTVIRNLISNAIKFTLKGGDIQIYAERENGMARIYIKDNGVGIKEENLEKLFRIDKQLKTKGTEGEEGTGLGLILCREFVEKNKGRIYAESVPGKGSTFSFTLPVST